ncbi:right-handed parallel beta-helix repeat-containing protein [Streptomyces sp. G2]|uniref:right-handed parallel beta-helix repeat-containing protein n=1 Tax=Streptomyces TaxID=1883 RepID=UPI002030F4A5|nr:right-handed parallel beta-helix repeat-containing protein [Streptomyces sp. G2]MCM1949310.1 right-handed parallel beta-helix repeat-containing protein [Streptomyces sp. G2]
MTKRQIALLACTVALAGSGLGAAAPGAVSRTVHLVKPGESIQKAVDAAKPGDTIVLTPGTYRESVRITTSRLTLLGSGSASTVLVPGDGTATDVCAKAGHGICVTGTDSDPVEGVTVRSLALRGFTANGLWASRTDRLTVREVLAEKNGKWGIAQERSTRGVFSHNTARNNADAGLFLANTIDTEAGATDAEGTLVTRNSLTGNRIGLTVRRLRNVNVDHNEATGNCAAVFVVGDESTPRAGAMTLRRNNIHTNNKYCPKTPRLPFLQGSGIVLTGAEETVVEKNRVVGNVGASPLSGGIVLFKSFVGVPNAQNAIRDNVVVRNSPADLADRDTGPGNTFTRNTCTLSEPAGMC